MSSAGLSGSQRATSQLASTNLANATGISTINFPKWSENNAGATEASNSKQILKEMGLRWLLGNHK